MSDDHDENHGHSVAAWTGVFALIIASGLISVGVAWGAHLWTFLGIAVGVVGFVGSIVLSKTGFGVEAKRLQAQGHQGVR
ncbi:HGxxPAAW family protein [Luteipulveratus mongoliensis]|uniref:Uncharacterized protein n=1 Tax=Luteipulveratus mongoliensis TaxID=571913 RepID=A0A0K1JJ77_9MICO|nr:HGxxPAAW family protein [Luteipulveratus mongoliensis]AKU16751.1 hypothetical protein VV02_14205 [Luteipulveratus mongoliensis]